jgi:hypothetical protein
MRPPQATYNRASFYAKTVELQPHELPPPPNAAERLIDALVRAARDAGDVGDDMANAINELLNNARSRTKRAA